MKWKRCRYLIGICIMMLISLLNGCGKSEERSEVEALDLAIETEEEDSVETEAEMEKEIYVYVCGQVCNPGVYTLGVGSRVTHAIQAAGGMTEQAAFDFLNQAEILEDGQKIYVPTAEEVMSSSHNISEEEKDDGKINLNTADVSRLATLSGIGEARAEAIIAYREQHGDFRTVEDIMNVEGIKEGIFNRIRDQIKVE